MSRSVQSRATLLCSLAFASRALKTIHPELKQNDTNLPRLAIPCKEAFDVQVLLPNTALVV
jgi:hypothetical protein